MKKLKQGLIVLVGSLLLVPTLAQATDNKGAKAPQRQAPKADIYIVPAPKDLPILLKYPAQIKSFQNVSVVSRVLGVLENKYFEEGQKVKKGDLLYKIEDNIYKAKVDAANASVKMSEATLDNAERNWKRVKRLYARKATTQEKRDVAWSSYNEALASLSLSKAELHQAQIDFDYTQVKAPIDGTIGLKKVDVGDLVVSNPPTSLVEITQNDKVFVEFSMPFSDYVNIKNNIWTMPENKVINVTLEIDGKATKRSGAIDFMDVNVNKETSTVKMRAVVDNSDGYLMSGSFVRVLLNDITQKNIITIPQKAVLQNPLGTIVFIEDKGVVAIRPVKIGNESGDKFVLNGGPLKSGDKVIVNNFFRVKPGAPVVVDKVINKEQ
ncbi:efflux RND transporter periplasmic adaptor subunit [Sulfurospirillum arcachonense]|uniref:efflux RND transporter periplasmic adaptor subunit n=1 Tax=Sulfurospirillum arcachonense TaxID=57666 RepID=UPI0004680E30|nr:efflux RND transporter periplasmic adaptor subunit [Sulfurospirillum arcachonense]